eukprot:TRINITY_DN6322_c0_g1_i1.p1 TRINITY_DN6322_c0_g1~~TRINITY_DN6322_c0_g1_i1.p1  ORF type:complete len:908 (+),score=125.53 TRINITY_DN6322_c0_g1_i1:48-2771(+)
MSDDDNEYFMRRVGGSEIPPSPAPTKRTILERLGSFRIPITPRQNQESQLERPPSMWRPNSPRAAEIERRPSFVRSVVAGMRHMEDVQLHRRSDLLSQALQRKHGSKDFEVEDVYNKKAAISSADYTSPPTWRARIKQRLTHPAVVQVPFFVLLGFGGATLAVLHEALGDLPFLGQLRQVATSKLADVGAHFVFQFIVYIIVCVFFAAQAAACTKYISAAAAGSGVPEMKMCISGVIIKDVLSMRTLVSKLLGLLAAQAAGLSVGKEGPFVHIAGALAHQLLRLPYFRILRHNPSYFLELLSVAATAGFVANFGAPIAGVLFTLEVTATTYRVSSLWKNVVVATMVLLFVRIYRFLKLVNVADIAIFSTRFPDVPFGRSGAASFFGELAAYVSIGVVCGCLGALAVAVTAALVNLRMRKLPHSHFKIVIVATFLIAITSYPFVFLRPGQKEQINSFLAPEDLPAAKWGSGVQMLVQLAVYVVREFFASITSFVLPIPVGVFTPAFTIGAGLGRLVGETIKYQAGSSQIVPGAYAVVGAAAMTSGMTRTLSTAVMVFELTGQLAQALPILIAVCVSIQVGNFFNYSIFDTILRLRKLPYMELDDGNSGKRLYAADVMRTDLATVPVQASFVNIAQVLLTRYAQYPLVQPELSDTPQNSRRSLLGSTTSNSPPILLGTVLKKDLVAALQDQRDNQQFAMDEPDVINFFMKLETDNSPEALDSSTTEAKETVVPLLSAPHSVEMQSPVEASTRPLHSRGNRRASSTSTTATPRADPVLGPMVFDDEDEEEEPGTPPALDPQAGEPYFVVQAPTLTQSPPPALGHTKPDSARLRPSSCLPPRLSPARAREQRVAIPFNAAPLQISPFTPLAQVQDLMSMVATDHLLVTLKGRLLGVVTKRDLIAVHQLWAE